MPVGTGKRRKRTANGAVSADDHQLVVFKIAGEEFGVEINEVKEIIRWTDVTQIPNSEAYIKGVINLRGNIVVVNDLAMKLGLPSKNIDDETRILVVEVEDNTIGMVVDSATEVLRLDAEKIKEAPSMITESMDHNYIDGVGILKDENGDGRLLTLLNLGKVMNCQDYERILEAQKIGHANVRKDQEGENISKTIKSSKSSKNQGTKKKESKGEAHKNKGDKKTDEKSNSGKKSKNKSSQKTSQSKSNHTSPEKNQNKESNQKPKEKQKKQNYDGKKKA